MLSRNEDLSEKGVVLLLSHLLTASTPHLGCWWWDHFVICWISYQFIWLFSTLHFKVEVPPARSSHSCLLPCWQTVEQVQLERLSNQAFLPSPQPPSPCPTVHAWFCRFFHSHFFTKMYNFHPVECWPTSWETFKSNIPPNCLWRCYCFCCPTKWDKKTNSEIARKQRNKQTTDSESKHRNKPTDPNSQFKELKLK